MVVGIRLSAQTFECATVIPISEEMEEQIPYPDCTLESYEPICVRVKFHFLNNTSKPSQAPGDAFCFDLLNRINETLSAGKIHLTFDYNCIHRGDLTTQIDMNTDISDLIGSNDPEVDYDPNSINLYFLQSSPNNTYFGSFTGKHAVLPIDDFPALIHEVGHTLGLDHTFNASITGLCKDPAAVDLSNSVPLCQEFGDQICDTGIDPYLLDLNSDSSPDGTLWVDLNTCTQSEDLLPSIYDDCYDMTTPWNIPIHNFMSYYQHCRTEFTPCQFGKIHERFLADHHEVLLDCGEDPYLIELAECDSPDIIISTITVWEDKTKYMCPGQKIIITPTGHLTIDNCTITRALNDVPNGTCPNLFFERLWDGIYIEGQGATVLSEGNYITLGGLVIKHSTVEYSKNGIKGLKGFGKIEMIDVDFQHNMNVLSVRDFWPLNYATGEGISTGGSYTNGTSLCGFSIYNPYPEVDLIDSRFAIGLIDLSSDPLSKTQILVDGASLMINNCKISNPNVVSSLTDLTAIKSGRGKLSILNGTVIDSFNVGVFKAADIYNNCSPRGLYMDHSSIRNTQVSIHSTTQYAIVRGNWLEGNINTEGLSYSSWTSNHFLKGLIFGNQPRGIITLQSPTESCYFSENLLDMQAFDFYGNNQKSYSLCNTWEDMEGDYAVVGEALVDMPLSWGQDKSSSGNRHLDDEDLPIFFSEDAIKNYHYVPNAQENFSYEYLFTGANAQNAAGCSYGLYPITNPVYNSSFEELMYNYTDQNTKWNALDSDKASLEADYSTASPTDQLLILEQINEIDMQESDVVRSVLSNIESSDESIENTWLGRSNPDLKDVSEVMAFWYARDYEGIDSILYGTSDDDAEVFLNAVNYIAGIAGRDIVVDSLPELQLDTLLDYAAGSYGNYTNILRDFLNLTYGLDLYWPVEEAGLIPRSSKKDNNSSFLSSKPEFTIYPNPAKDCFTIKKIIESEESLQIEIFDLQGRLRDSMVGSSGEEVCFGDLDAGVYFLRVVSGEGRKIETHKIIFQ
ncbi:MAG: zinc-dependent metalloprotease [Saprospiraceae bacterium]